MVGFSRHTRHLSNFNIIYAWEIFLTLIVSIIPQQILLLCHATSLILQSNNILSWKRWGKIASLWIIHEEAQIFHYHDYLNIENTKKVPKIPDITSPRSNKNVRKFIKNSNPASISKLSDFLIISSLNKGFIKLAVREIFIVWA